ncbi:helix-turn-helix domain-containing protein [Streptococcus sp. 121]|nr:helix-turn-helix domain-containing protein [Streptococcus sp. 121]
MEEIENRIPGKGMREGNIERWLKQGQSHRDVARLLGKAHQTFLSSITQAS